MISPYQERKPEVVSQKTREENDNDDKSHQEIYQEISSSSTTKNEISSPNFLEVMSTKNEEIIETGTELVVGPNSSSPTSNQSSLTLHYPYPSTQQEIFDRYYDRPISHLNLQSQNLVSMTQPTQGPTP